MELVRCAKIIQGSIPTRIEVTNGQAVETITMQELNYVANISDDKPVSKCLTVQHDKLINYTLTKTNDVVIGLSSGKAMVIESNREDKLVLSNLAIIRVNDQDMVDPYYLCWYINNNIGALKKMQQGTYSVSIIPLSMLKGLDITLLPISKQRLIGKIYDLKRRRDRLTQIIEKKKSEILSQKIVNVFEKEVKNGKE